MSYAVSVIYVKNAINDTFDMTYALQKHVNYGYQKKRQDLRIAALYVKIF